MELPLNLQKRWPKFGYNNNKQVQGSMLFEYAIYYF